MSNVPVQNQDLGICYAYSASQLTDALRHKNQLEKGQRVDRNITSPVFTALNSKKTWSNKSSQNLPFEAGDLCNAFNNLKEIGSCYKSSLDSFFAKEKINEKTFFLKILKIEEEYKKYRDQILKEKNKGLFSFNASNLTGFNLFNQANKENTKSFDYLTNQFQENKIIACERSTLDNLYDQFKDVFKEAFVISRRSFRENFDVNLFDSPEDLVLIFSSICADHKKNKLITNLSCSRYSMKNAIKSNNKTFPFTQKILHELKRNSLPVGISYCSKFLYKGDSYKGLTKAKDGKVTSSKDCGAHSSLIIGSRWNTSKNTCELLIRNTWGKQCNSYKANYPSKAELKKKGRTVSQFDFNCEDGNIWIDYKTIENNTYMVQHL